VWRITLGGRISRISGPPSGLFELEILRRVTQKVDLMKNFSRVKNQTFRDNPTMYYINAMFGKKEIVSPWRSGPVVLSTPNKMVECRSWYRILPGVVLKVQRRNVERLNVQLFECRTKIEVTTPNLTMFDIWHSKSSTFGRSSTFSCSTFGRSTFHHWAVLKTFGYRKKQSLV
jgi:hypothetical protein